MAENIGLIMCEYVDCDTCLPMAEMRNVGEEFGSTFGHPTWVCASCEDKVVDESGYCDISCQLGYGCDQSC